MMHTVGCGFDESIMNRDFDSFCGDDAVRISQASTASTDSMLRCFDGIESFRGFEGLKGSSGSPASMASQIHKLHKFPRHSCLLSRVPSLLRPVPDPGGSSRRCAAEKEMQHQTPTPINTNSTRYTISPPTPHHPVSLIVCCPSSSSHIFYCQRPNLTRAEFHTKRPSRF
jgi:hypothetical protein